MFNRIAKAYHVFFGLIFGFLSLAAFTVKCNRIGDALVNVSDNHCRKWYTLSGIKCYIPTR